MGHAKANPSNASTLSATKSLWSNLESIEQLLRVAERSRGATAENGQPLELDSNERLSELLRREEALDARELGLEKQQMALDQCAAKLRRSYERLRRSIARFDGDVAKRSGEIDQRADQLGKERSELNEARRALARETIELKKSARRRVA